MSSAPADIWLVDGEQRAGTWRPVAVEARFAGRIARVMRQVGPGETVELPDLVLPRPVSLAGRVLDAAGRPVPGALVSPHALRARLAAARECRVVQACALASTSRRR